MKDLEILEILKVLQSNKNLILEKVSGKGGDTEVVLVKYDSTLITAFVEIFGIV